MTNILLIQPAVSYKEKINALVSDCPHLGLLYLAAALKKDYNVQYIDDIDNSLELEDIGDIIKRHKISVVCITAMTQNIKGAIHLAAFLQYKKLPVKVVLGGPHLSADPTLPQRWDFFDAAITGEAELTLPKIIPHLLNNKYVGTVKGKTPMELDELSFPERSIVNYDEYKKRGYWTNPIFATRGCPYRCNFCSIPAIDRRVRFRSADNIVEEMQETYSITKIELFDFVDDALTMKKEFTYQLCSQISKLPFKVKWEAQTRADYVDRDLLVALRESGCYKLLFGVESGNERIRNEIIGKHLSNAQVKKATDLCWEVGIEPDHYLMVGQPTETKEELNDTINCPKFFNPNIIGVFLTVPLPGSPLYQRAQEENKIPRDVIDRYVRGDYGEGYEGCWPYYIPEGLTLQDLLDAKAKALKQFYLRPSYIAKRLWRDFKSPVKLRRDIREGWSLLTKGKSRGDYG